MNARGTRHSGAALLAGMTAALSIALTVRADIAAPPVVRNVRIEEHLGASVPLDAVFTTSDGDTAPLRTFFDGRRPVLLTLFYTRCPMLCGLVLDGAGRAMGGAAHQLGSDYRALSISIDPHETSAAAASRRGAATASLPGGEGWTFLVGDEPTIARVAAALGFAYRYDPPSQQYAHPAAWFVLTADGRISRYVYGFDTSAGDLDAALSAAAVGEIGQGGLQQVLLQCFRFMPVLRRYGGAVHALLAIAGALIVLALSAVVAVAVYARHRAEVAS
jgi:protein SCO1